MLPLPPCAHCHKSELESQWAEMGVEFCECRACGKLTRVVEGVAYKGGDPACRPTKGKVWPNDYDLL